jgi:predicted regulator of Ras-like GTPase activity (Roadblock/LC7/MglB family)
MQELDWLLVDLQANVAGVMSAVVLSPDGLPLGKSPGLTEQDAEHLAALAAGAFSLARGTGTRFGCGEVNQAIIEMEQSLLFIAPAGRGTCLALIAEATADAGLIAYEMSVLVKRVGQHMVADPRFPVTGGV